MAEEFAFEQVLRDGRAIDRDVGLVDADAVLVDRARDEFLAGAAFAGDENGRAGRRDLADELVDLLHRGRIADDGLVAFVGTELGREGNDLLHRVRGGERLGEQDFQLGDVERLEHVIIRAALHRLDRGLRRAVGGHHHDDLLRIHLAQFFQRVEAALLAHADVHHDQVGMMLARKPDAFVARFGAQDFQRLLVQQPAEGIMDILLIVDDEDTLARFVRSGGGPWARRCGTRGASAHKR